MSTDKPWVIPETAPAANPLLRTLQATRASGRMALCGYFLSGYPSPQDFYQLVRTAEGLDVIEFGIPSPHPALDGDVIAAAHEVVTGQRGIDAETAMALIGGLRHLPQSRFVMIYTAVGRALTGFLRLCVENGVHGVIAPDIGPEEGEYVSTIGRALNLAVIMLLDARADDETVARCVPLADAIYLKAAPGRTGQPADLEGELGEVIAGAMRRIRALDPAMPVAVGIGIQRPEQVAALARLDVDMAIVGTKVVEHVNQGEQALVEYVASLRAATRYPEG